MIFYNSHLAPESKDASSSRSAWLWPIQGLGLGLSTWKDMDDGSRLSQSNLRAYIELQDYSSEWLSFFSQGHRSLVGFIPFDSRVLKMKENPAREDSLISSFPSELLIHIFKLANQFCACEEPLSHQHRIDALVLSQVCKYWRNVCLNCGSLWSHIDLVVDSHVQTRMTARALVFRQRTRNSPLHLHLRQNNNKAQMSIATQQLLLKNSELACSLEVSLNSKTPEHWLVVIACLAKAKASGSIKSCSMEYLDEEAGSTFDPSVVPAEPRVIPYMGDQHLLSLKSLHLNSVTIKWDSLVYSGLLDLTIESIPLAHSPTLADLAQIFEVSPNLRRLRLAKVTICADASRPLPVRLEHLQELDLGGLDVSTMCALLTIIRPGTKEMSASLKLENQLTKMHPVSEFFENAKLTRLFVDASCRGSWIAWVLRALKPLQELTFYNFDITYHQFPQLLDINYEAETPPIWPNLRSLNLVHSRPDGTILRNLVEIHPHLTSVRLFGCTIDVDSPGSRGWDLEKLAKVLRNDAPDERKVKISDEFQPYRGFGWLSS